MSEYQRFISYMYEYRGNNRFTNCGYARIDNRNQLLKLEIHMKISSQSTEEPIHIYGCFQRDGQLYGVELGQHTPALGMVNWRTQCGTLGLAGTDISFSDLEGLILTDQSPLSYCSIWNDQSIRPMDMIPYPSRESEELSADETADECSESGTTVSDRNASDTENETAQPFMEAQNTVLDTRQKDVTDSAQNSSQKDMTDSAADSSQKDVTDSAADSSQKDVTDSAAGSSQKDVTDFVSESANVHRENISQTPNGISLSSDAKNPQKSDVKDPSSVSAVSTPRTAPTLVERIMAQEYTAAEGGENNTSENISRSINKTSSGRFAGSARWQRLVSQYPHADTFTEGELKNCVRVEPRDFPRLRREGWNIAGNRFILHCFQRNAHCLIGRIGDTEQYIFAVPGIYGDQERFMANMFGFPCFKAIDPDAPLEDGQQGYWYRSLH